MITGEKYIDDLNNDNKGAILFSAHIGNWEICPLITTRKNLETTSIYRHANNPINETVIQWLRKGICHYAPKGPTGAKTIFKVLRNKKYAAVLADQKLNEGKLIDFLGHPAKTATAIAELSIKLSLPIVPVHVIRIKGPTFKYVAEKPIKMPNKKLDHEEKVLYILNRVNDIMGKWIPTSLDTQITSIQIHNTGSGSFDNPVEIQVWGTDTFTATGAKAVNGTIFEESDTGKHYMFDGTSTWNEM